MRTFLLKSISLLIVVFITACSSESKKPEEKVPPVKDEFVPTIDFEIISRIPHDTSTFTEGLFYSDQQLYESTGSPENRPNARSIWGIVDTLTGKINKKAELDSKYFGEGIVKLNNKIYQLTYKDQLGFIYDAKTYKLLDRFIYRNKEGWGMTTDGTSIIMSDGTNVLSYIDPVSLKETKTISVTNGGYAEDYLNELEFIDGFIYANIWTKNYVVKIDPATGKVVGLLEFASIADEARNKYKNTDVLNGIAYDPITKRMFVTGKFFPYIYVLKLSGKIL